VSKTPSEPLFHVVQFVPSLDFSRLIVIAEGVVNFMLEVVFPAWNENISVLLIKDQPEGTPFGLSVVIVKLSFLTKVPALATLETQLLA
jgi:hypothetical protein